jgi:hypothetical protein
LLALALRNEADDRGVFVWEPLQIKMRVLPADNVDVASLLEELLKHNLVRKFADQSGKEFGAIRNFRRWQRPEKPKVVYWLPNELEDYMGHSPKDGRTSNGSRQPVDDGSRNSAPEGAEGGSRSRTRERDSKEEPEAVQTLVSSRNSSLSSFDEASARARNSAVLSSSVGSGLEGQPPADNAQAPKSYLLESLKRRAAE